MVSFQHPGTQHDPSSITSSTTTPHVRNAGGPGSFFGFLRAYGKPPAWFTTPNTTATAVSGAAIGVAPTTTSETNISTTGSASSPNASPAPWKLPGGLEDINATTSSLNTRKDCSKRLYPMSTVLVVALIAFLIGSLLRSLLSPADFIYVVTDLREAEEANSVRGWREIRRLVEMKYVAGGWDFQIAVVRRH